VSLGLDTIERADRLSAEPADVSADLSTDLSTGINLSAYSQAVQAEFANGAQYLINNYKPEDFLPLSQATPEDLMKDMTPGEALMTYGIMHNPIMEEIAIAHASDAMAFANDVMLNFSRAIDQKQNAFIANMTIAEIEDMGDDGDDEDLTPAQRARKRAAAIEQQMRDLRNDLHQEQMEQMREEHMAQWDAQMHTIGGKQFSGADLHNMYLFMQDPSNYNRFTQQLESEGVSKEEAKKRADKLKRTLELLEKERQGRLSEEEQAELERLKRDKQVAADMEKFKEQYESGWKAGLTNKVDAVASQSTEMSASLGADLLANKQDISEPKLQAAAPSQQHSIFSSATPTEIKSETALTPTYNEKAGSTITVEPTAQPQQEQTQPKAAAAAPVGNYGFG